jgi:ribose 5-phosphate isomerase B
MARTIVCGSDHAGLRLKQELLKHLAERGYAATDLGTHTTDSCDYPDYAVAVARKVAAGEAELGLLVCGSGIGMAITANKVAGIRAAVVSDTFSAHASREHNDANVLCLGERVVGVGLAKDIVDVFLGAEFQGGRHAGRVDKITALDRVS